MDHAKRKKDIIDILKMEYYLFWQNKVDGIWIGRLPLENPNRKIPLVLIEEVNEHLQEMPNTEVIKENNSPYSSYVVATERRN